MFKTNSSALINNETLENLTPVSCKEQEEYEAYSTDANKSHREYEKLTRCCVAMVLIIMSIRITVEVNLSLETW